MRAHLRVIRNIVILLRFSNTLNTCLKDIWKFLSNIICRDYIPLAKRYNSFGGGI